MWVYWYTRGRAGEFRPLVEEVLRADPPLDPPDRALLLQAVASSRALTGEHEACLPVLRELAVLLEESGDVHGLAMAKAQIVASSPPTSAAESHRLLSEAVPVLDRIGDHWSAAYAWGVLGELLLSEGRAAEADAAQEASMAHARAVGSEHLIGLSLNERGLTALALGDGELARARYVESVQLHRRVQNRDGLASCLDGLARLALTEGRPELGAEAVGAADAIRDRIRSTVSPLIESLRAPLLAELDEALGTTAFETARAAGGQRDPDDLIEKLLPSAQAERP
jgi:hypothetical protein